MITRRKKKGEGRKQGKGLGHLRKRERKASSQAEAGIPQGTVEVMGRGGLVGED